MPNRLYLILGIIGFFCLGTVWLFYFYRHLYVSKKILQADRGIHRYVLTHLSADWCYWYMDGNFVECSTNLKRLLGLEVDCPLTVNELFKVLGDSPFSSFQKALSHIIDFGGEFHLNLPLFKQTLYLDIEGRVLAPPPPNDSTLPSLFEERQNLILLSFKDVTQLILEKNHNHHVQKQKEHEINILKTLINNLPLPVWCRDQQGRLEYCNTLYSQILETSFHRVLAENVELIDLHQPQNAYELSRKALQTGQSQTFRTHKVIGGTRHLLEIGETPVLESGITVGYAFDMTTTEKAQHELQQHLAAHREVLQYISAPIAIFDAKTELTFFNHAYLRLFDFDENWLCTGPTYGEILENLRERRKLPEYPNFLEYKRQSLSLFKNLMQPFHELLHLPEGHILRTVIAPHPLGGLIFLFDDITDKLSLERGYNTLVAVQKETLDHLYEGIIVFGTDNRLRLSNPAIEKIWNLGQESRVVGRHISEILKDIAPLFVNPYESRMWRKKMVHHINNRQADQGKITLKSHRMLDYSYVPLPDGSNLLTFIDISDQWRFQQTLSKQTSETGGNSRLVAELVFHASHELQSFLSTINGFSEILLNQYFGSLNERQIEYGQGITKACQRLTKLINDMVDLAHLESGKLNLRYQRIKMDEFFDEIIHAMSKLALEHDLEISLENHLHNKSVEVDPQRLRQIIANLLENAVKFTPAGGKISIKALLDVKNPYAFQLIVQDTGIGIPSDEKEHILEYLDNKQNQGTIRLGLYLVKKLVELHHGFFSVESVTPQGTAMICCFPIDPKSSSRMLERSDEFKTGFAL